MKTTLFVLFVALLLAGCGHKSKMLLGDAVRTPDLDNNETLNRVIAVATNSNDLKEYEDEGLTYTINGIDESKKTLFSGWAKERHENGQLYSLVQFKDGKTEGLWKKWNYQGLKQLEGRTRNGKLMICKSWRPNGEKCPLTNLKNGNGIVVSYDSNGSEEGRWSYSNGELKRTLTMTKRFYDSGMLREEGLADEKEGNSKKHGFWTYWYENGQKEAEINYKDGEQDGPYTTWYENGQKEFELSNKDGKGQLSTWWDKNGQKNYEENYKDGKLDGLSTFWYENGELERMRNWEKGTLNGTSTLWYESGQKRSKGNYKEGKLISVEVVWTPNGEKCPKSNVKDGTGVIVRYLKNGKKELEVKFKNGEPIGKPRKF